jgi:hypothetical protein
MRLGRRALDERLPRQVGLGRAGNDTPESVVGNGRERIRQGGWKLARFGHRAGDPPLGGTVDRAHRADVESQLACFDPAFAKPRAHLTGQERELVSPNARRDAQHQNAIIERNRLRAFRDPGADRVAPYGGRYGGTCPRKAGFTGALENRFERLGHEELLSR